MMIFRDISLYEPVRDPRTVGLGVGFDDVRILV